MDDDHDALAHGADQRHATPDHNEMRERVPARLLHLDSFGRTAMERAVRILRAYFIDRRSSAPRRGTLHWLMLVGDPADAGKPVKWDNEPIVFDIWGFVDHEAYKGLERYWGRAKAVLKSELGRAIAVELSVFTIDEAERFHLTNPWLAKRYDGGIILFDRAMDPPRSAERQTIHDRITAAADALDEPQRTAFAQYRRRGFDLARIARKLDASAAEAEMHLSEAFGALLASLGDDTQPQSLRPGLGQHPRHNLDLYHRPGDFDRILAVTFYRRAMDFVGLMVEGDARDRPSLVVREAAYASEFALKTLLLRAGYSDEWNRQHIGLDLTRGLGEAQANGMPPPSPELARLIPPLSRYHRQGRTPDQARAVLAVMPPAEIVETVATLLDAVGRITGYTGLPGERDA
ncbi:sigma-70 family RNA polymerase sigma factor [Sphingobium psychrophilum]|uniref:sigma-70 family RNA polymerase sigma factor n=1 Tax=Sphingobium psychrophilum TaxID=2728834 RepID=UPI0019D148A7|nr:sigma-70 family RNA polymerase sigma factor [Sphingobium psychrophilum]